MTLAERFAERGYVIVRGVLNPEEVTRARELCAQRLTEEGASEMLTSDFLTARGLAEIPLRDKVVEAIRELIGERFRLYPNFTARKNIYVDWHVDDAFVGPGREYVWEPDFLHIQGGLYLQENNTVNGGGIDVLRGSHQISFDGYGKVPAEFDIPARTLGKGPLREMVDTGAGDLVLWNARLMHASTPVVEESGHGKFGVFFSYGRDDLRANSNFLCQLASSRVRTMNGRSGVIPRLAELVHFSYPDSFPEWFVKQAADSGVELYTL